MNASLQTILTVLKCYTYNALQMAEVLAKDLKLGQYMHLAPRKSFVCASQSHAGKGNLAQDITIKYQNNMGTN